MNVALGIGGGIAAYKAAELARALSERGFGVQAIMTAAAKEFVEDLTPAAEYEKQRAPVVRPLFIRPKGLGRPTKKDRRSLDKLW